MRRWNASIIKKMQIKSPVRYYYTLTRLTVLNAGFPWWLRWQRICCPKCGRPEFDHWVGKMPWRRAWQPTPVFLPEVGHDWATKLNFFLAHAECYWNYGILWILRPVSWWEVEAIIPYNLAILLLCVYVKSLQLCLILCDPIDCSHLRGLFSLWDSSGKDAGVCYTRGSSQPRDQTWVSYVSCIGRRVLYHQCHLGSPFLLLKEMKVSQSCPTLCDPMDSSLAGSSVHRILQARILEWEAVPFSRGSSQPRRRTQVSQIAGGFFTICATREALDSVFIPRQRIKMQTSLCLQRSV